MKSLKKGISLFMATSMICSLYFATPMQIVSADYAKPIKQVSLNYTRDVFISTPLNGTIDTYAELNPIGLANEKFAFDLGYSYAMNEQRLKERLLLDENNAFTFDGVKYQFGPLGTLEASSSALNAVRAKDSSNLIKIDIADGAYESIRFIANAYNSGNTPGRVPATVTIYFLDGTSQVTNIDGIINYRASTTEADPTLPANEVSFQKLLHNKGVGAPRSNGTACVEMSGWLCAYYMTPTAGKIVDYFTVNCANSVVYAASTVGSEKAALITSIENSIGAISNTPTLSDRKMIEGIRNTIDNGKKEQGLLDTDIDSVILEKFLIAEKSVSKLLRYNKQLDLPYNKDLFVIENVEYMEGSNNDQSTTPESNIPFAANFTLNGVNIAMFENRLKVIPGFNMAKNTLTVDNIEFKLGAFGSGVTGNSAPNVMVPVDGGIVLDVENVKYKTINFLATVVNTGNPASAVIAVKYADGTTVNDTNITAISSFRTISALQTGETFVGNMGARRQFVWNSGSSKWDTGFYDGRLYKYSIQIDPTKALDKITIWCGSAVVLAATTEWANGVENPNKYQINSIDNQNFTVGSTISSANITQLNYIVGTDCLYAVLYNQQNQLCDVRCVDLSLTPGVTRDITFEPLTITATDNKLKVFIWDEKLTPNVVPFTK